MKGNYQLTKLDGLKLLGLGVGVTIFGVVLANVVPKQVYSVVDAAQMNYLELDVETQEELTEFLLGNPYLFDLSGDEDLNVLFESAYEFELPSSTYSDTLTDFVGVVVTDRLGTERLLVNSGELHQVEMFVLESTGDAMLSTDSLDYGLCCVGFYTWSTAEYGFSLENGELEVLRTK